MVSKQVCAPNVTHSFRQTLIKLIHAEFSRKKHPLFICIILYESHERDCGRQFLSAAGWFDVTSSYL